MTVELAEDELDETESDWTVDQMMAELIAEVERLQAVNAALLTACRAIIVDQDSNALGRIIDRDEERAGCKCSYCQVVRLCRAAVAMAEEKAP